MTGHILVVDGVPTNRITMKVRLAAACYEVTTATTGVEALQLARQIHPDIVLIGGSLRDMEGAALCTALRSLPGGAKRPILVQASGGERVEALRAGAAGLIDPGGDDLTLLARIRGLMRHECAAAEESIPGLGEEPAPSLDDSHSRAVFIGDQPSTAMGWRHALQNRVDFSISISESERALAEATSGRAADLYLIAADIQQPGDGLRLLSELRSRPLSRDARSEERRVGKGRRPRRSRDT